MIDSRVQRRLAVDHRYIYAEDAEQQANAERAIELEVELELLELLGIDRDRVDAIRAELGEVSR